MRRIYLDYNATTPLKPAVYEGMLPYLKDNFGNPSSIHWSGREAKKALMTARESVARLLHAHADDVVFTSGGTEANNLALKGAFAAHKKEGRHIITTKVEHTSILDGCDYLKEQGADVSYLSVNSKGEVDPEELKSTLRADTILVSIQAANNETGVRLPVHSLGKIIKAYNEKILFHIDAVQMAGKLPIYLDEIPYDMVSISSHKMNGPKGAGALIIKRGVTLEALIHGGNQERKRRGGTENIPAIVGFGLACDVAKEEGIEKAERRLDLRDRLEEGVLDRIPNCHINGREARRVPNTSNITFEGVSSEAILLNLDLQGIAASSGSACSSGSLNPSHVLMAMGHSKELSLSSVRFSVGYQTMKEDIDAVLDVLPGIVSDLRKSKSQS